MINYLHRGDCERRGATPGCEVSAVFRCDGRDLTIKRRLLDCREGLKRARARYSNTVKLGKAGSPKVIRRRTRAKLDFYRKVMRYAKRQSTRNRYMNRYKRLKKLFDGRIERRIWREALENPSGPEDLTITYGKAGARRMQERAMRRKFGRLRRVT